MFEAQRYDGRISRLKKKLRSFLITLGLMLFSLLACIAVKAEENVSGIWELKGTHSIRGEYVGEMEIRPKAGGSFNIIRIVDYQTFSFKGLHVQEVWTGTGSFKNGVLTVNYNFRQGDFILSYNNEKRSDEDFASNIVVTSTIDMRGELNQSEFLDVDHSLYKDEFYEKRALDTDPLWVDQKERLLAEGAETIFSDIAKTVLMTYFKANVRNFWSDPFVKKYEKREEFKAGKYYYIFDPTDYRFYQENKNVLRVVNKKIDNISLLESMARQMAYSHSLEEKARGFDKNYVENHMTPQGLLAEAHLDKEGNFIKFTGNGDGALWSGVYASAQAMKYKTLQDSDPEEALLALENVKKTVRGLFLLMDIQGDKKKFARTAIPWNESDPGAPWSRGKGAYSHLIYIYDGNNDMLKGLFTGFLWAALTVPKSDTKFWDELKEHALRLSDLSVVHDRPMNRPIAIGVAAVVTGDPRLKEAYESYYLPGGKNLAEKTRNLFKRIKNLTYWDFKLNPNVQWPGYLGTSGVHLTIVTNITQIMIAQKLGIEKLRQAFQKNFMEEWVTYHGLQRHLLAIAAYTFASKEGPYKNSWDGVSDLDKKWKNSMEKAIWGLREFPYPRPNFDVTIDFSKRPDWCLSNRPGSYEDSAGPHPIEHFYQGIYQYPLFQKLAWSNDYIWKSEAYLYKTAASSNTEFSSADYLYAYWMARWSGLISEND